MRRHKTLTELEQWVELFGILAKYEFPDFTITAEHDQVWLHFPTSRLSYNDRTRLWDLGWRSDFENTAITQTF